MLSRSKQELHMMQTRSKTPAGDNSLFNPKTEIVFGVSKPVLNTEISPSPLIIITTEITDFQPKPAAAFATWGTPTANNSQLFLSHQAIPNHFNI